MEGQAVTAPAPSAQPVSNEGSNEAVAPKSGINATKDPVKKVKAPQPKQAAPEKPGYKLVKIDGTEYEVPEKDFFDAARHSLTANKRMYEATQLQKKLMEDSKRVQELEAKYSKFESMSPEEQFEAVLSRAKDPNASKAVRQKAEEWLIRQIEMDEASPEKKELMKERATREELEAKLKERETKDSESKYAQEKTQHQQSAQQDIISILDTSGLPPTEWNVKRVADLMYNARQAAKKNPAFKFSNEQMADFIKQDTIDSTGALYGNIADNILKAKESGSAEEILKYGKYLEDNLPASVLRAIRIYDLTKHTSSRPQNTVSRPVDVQKATGTKESGSYEYKSMDEWIEARKRRYQSA